MSLFSTEFPSHEDVSRAIVYLTFEKLALINIKIKILSSAWLVILKLCSDWMVNFSQMNFKSGVRQAGPNKPLLSCFVRS